MKKIKKLISSPFFHIVVLYLIEIAITVFMIAYVNDALIKKYEGFRIVGYILKLFTFVMFLYVVFYKSMDYAYRINWILLFLLSPTFGGLIYALVSRKRPLPKKIQKFYRYKNKYNGNHLNEILWKEKGYVDETRMLDEKSSKTARYIQNTTYYPLYSHTESEFLYKGENAWARIKDDLKKAKHYIYLEFYIIAKGVLWDEVEKILIEKAKNGVEVKILFDDMGSISKIDKKLLKKLTNNNIKWARFNSIKLHLDSSLNFRNHRKIVVIDGNIGYTGGINLADEYINVNSPFGVWFDCGIRLSGDGCDALLLTFLKDWWFATSEKLSPKKVDTPFPTLDDGYVQFYSDSPFDKVPIARNALLTMLGNSKKFMYIATPYLALDDETMDAIILAATSGVDVRIVLPGIPDKKIVYTITESHFEKLINNGVKIYTYTPGFLHAKILFSDDIIANVGSVNLDYRSFYLNFECGVALYSTESLKAINNAFEELFKDSKHIETYKETVWFKIKHNIIRFLTPFF